jgi:hypothetical protein
MWIDTYLMAMGIASHNELLATCYLPLLVDGNARQWLNTLPKDIFDCWDEMRTEFVWHF